MEVRPGYKQTEVGIIPDEWNPATLASISAFITKGATPTTYGFKWEQNGVLFLRSECVSEKGLDLNQSMFISREAHNMMGRSHVRCGDLLITITGYVGRVVFLSKIAEANVNQHIARIRVISDKADAHYVYHFLSQPSVRRKYNSITTGQAYPQISLKQVRETIVPLPFSKAEQEAIAEALSDADALIGSLELLITKKRALKQGAMQELLRPKEGWIERRLGDTAILKARIGWQGLTTDEYIDSGDFYLVAGTDFKDGYIDWDNCHYVAESRYKQDKYIQLKEQDVLVTKDGTIGKVALITNLEKPATLNSGVFVVRPIDDAFYPDFFYYLLCSNLFAAFLGQLSAGSTINHLYQKDFINFIYKTPGTIDEQRDIASILTDMDAEIAALEGKLAKAWLVKQGMMQELLTGRIRLVEPKCSARGIKC